MIADRKDEDDGRILGAMNPWVRVVGALAAIVAAAFLLKLLPPLLVLAMVIGAFWYVSHRLRTAERTERPVGAELLGLKREAADPFGLLGYPLQLFTRSGEPAIDELVWGRWRGLEVRVFGLSLRAPSLSADAVDRTGLAGALTVLGSAVPSLVVEPQAFVTTFERAPELQRVVVSDDAFDDVWAVWSSDRAFALEVLTSGMRDWLGSLGERWGIELGDRMATVYGPTPERPDVVAVLEALQELLARLPGGHGPPAAEDKGPTPAVEDKRADAGRRTRGADAGGSRPVSDRPTPDPPSAPGPIEQPRALRRSRDDRVIAGVCSGLGRYLGLDPILLRIAFVILAIAGGGGVLVYLVSWILIPEAREGEVLGTERPSNIDATRLIVGGTLIALGTILLLNLSIPRIGRYFWPLALIAIGVAVVIQSSMSRR